MGKCALIRAEASWTMTLADFSIAAFALLNGGRVIAYMPQIVSVYRCQNGATAVSLLTWIMFSAANAATVTYALTVSSDLVVAGTFGLNALGCIIIAALVAFRRLSHGRRTEAAPIQS
jgi:uncharacterized protein with PQ loop repeat